MESLVSYYLHQAGRGHADNGIALYTQMRLTFSAVMESAVFWEACCVRLCVFALARCQVRGFRGTSYRTKHTDMADPNAKFSDVFRRNLRDSVHRVLKRLRGQGRKRKRLKAGNGLRDLRRI